MPALTILSYEIVGDKLVLHTNQNSIKIGKGDILRLSIIQRADPGLILSEIPPDANCIQINKFIEMAEKGKLSWTGHGFLATDDQISNIRVSLLGARRPSFRRQAQNFKWVVWMEK